MVIVASSCIFTNMQSREQGLQRMAMVQAQTSLLWARPGRMKEGGWRLEEYWLASGWGWSRWRSRRRGREGIGERWGQGAPELFTHQNPTWN